MDLARALELSNRELVSFVGAGGKKTAMARLVGRATVRDLRVGYTTTTHTPPPEGPPLVVSAPGDLLGSLGDRTPVAFAASEVPDPDRADRKLRGYDPSVVDRLHRSGRFDWLLVKADGARRREFKAPGSDEPPLPGETTQLVPVASVKAVGRPLDQKTAHRPERVAAITGLDPGDVITPEAVARVLASPEGGCKRCPAGATVTPLVNKADSDQERETAGRILAYALDGSDRIDRGLVTSFRAETCEVVTDGDA